MDIFDQKKRSKIMSCVRGKNTRPELALRSALHRMGLRFRLFRRDLPGTPDIVFARKRLAVQVRGCFWHQHTDCPAGRLPNSRLEFWRPKLQGNVARDAAKDAKLTELGWKVLVIWECELKSAGAVALAAGRVAQELDSGVVAAVGIEPTRARPEAF